MSIDDYEYEEPEIEECEHIDCNYWGQGGCMLPDSCIYWPDENK